jgi:hypothetical protein
MSSGSRRPWWSRLWSIYFVVSIVVPTTAPFQVVGIGEALRFAHHPGVATRSTVSPGRAVTNEAGVPSWRVAAGRPRHRSGLIARYRQRSTVDAVLFHTSLKRNLPGLSSLIDQQQTVLRI